MRSLILLATIGAGALGATPVSARAQVARALETEAELLEKIEALRPLVEDARLAAETATAARMVEARAAAAGRPVDTLRLGSVTVLSPPEDASLARALFTEVWADRFAPLGVPSLDAWTFVFRRDDHPAPFVAAPGDGVREVRVRDWEVPSRGRELVRDALARAVLSESDLGGALVGDPFVEPDVELHYRILATHDSKATRACLGGDVPACEHALGLGLPTGVNPIEVWYTPEQRRILVSRVTWPSTSSFPAAAYGRCRAGSDLAACDALLDEPMRRWIPLSGSTRSSILWLALQRGGTDAWSRLVEHSSAPPEEVLERVSGMELDDLVAEWRRWVLANRPISHAGLGGRSALTLLWIALFLTLATRSTRWRLG